MLLYIEYAFLSLLVLVPLLLPGFVLTMDLVFTPRLAFPQEITNTYLLQGLLWLLNLMLPGDVIEKLMLFAILFLSGVGMHRLVLSLRTKHFSAEQVKWGAYFAGIFYMINPFVYSRFMTGQWMVLLGYALTPFFFMALLKLLYKPDWRSAVVLAAWIFGIVSVSLHHAGIVAVLLLATLAVVIFSRHLARRKIILWGAGSCLLASLASLYWLIPAVSGTIGTIGSSIAQFDTAHFTAFATVGYGPLGPLSEVIRLQGFWAEPLKLFTLPREVVPAWGILMLGMWILVGFGIKKGWQVARMPTLTAVISAGIAIIFAATPLLEYVSRFLPVVAGYREPHKFVGLVALAYALCGALAVMAIARYRKTKKQSEIVTSIIMIGLLLLPIAITPTMLWGFRNQLTARHYPADWQKMDEYMQAHIPHQSVLFLPWHQYMSFPFAGRIIANPAQKYFKTPLIVSDDPEFKHISPNVPNVQKQQISGLLKSQTLTQLSDVGVHYILLAKAHDSQKYHYIYTDRSALLIHETQTLALFKVKGD